MPRPKEDVQTDRAVGEVAHELKNMFRTFFVKFRGWGNHLCDALPPVLPIPEALLNTDDQDLFTLRSVIRRADWGLSPQEYGFANGTVGLIGLASGWDHWMYPGKPPGTVSKKSALAAGLRHYLAGCGLHLSDFSLNSDLIVVSSCLFVEQLGYGLGFTVLTL